MVPPPHKEPGWGHTQDQSLGSALALEMQALWLTLSQVEAEVRHEGRLRKLASSSLCGR